MSRAPREYPLLAGDVVRARLCLAVFLPVNIGMSMAGAFLGVEQSGLLTYHFSWVLFSLMYIVLALVAFLRADADTLARWLRATPRPRTRRQRVWWRISGYGAIDWALGGGLVSLLTMIFLVSSDDRTAALMWTGVAALTASWALVAVSFAVHYARQHAIEGGLDFPGAAPKFSDFLYLALQLSTTYAGSDVSITTSRMRAVATLHSVIAFLFNTVIIAVLVSVLLAAAG